MKEKEKKGRRGREKEDEKKGGEKEPVLQEGPRNPVPAQLQGEAENKLSIGIAMSLS